VCGFFGNYLGAVVASQFAIFCLSCSFLLSIYSFLTVGLTQQVLFLTLGPCFQLDLVFNNQIIHYAMN